MKRSAAFNRLLGKNKKSRSLSPNIQSEKEREALVSTDDFIPFTEFEMEDSEDEAEQGNNSAEEAEVEAEATAAMQDINKDDEDDDAGSNDDDNDKTENDHDNDNGNDNDDSDSAVEEEAVPRSPAPSPPTTPRALTRKAEQKVKKRDAALHQTFHNISNFSFASERINLSRDCELDPSLDASYTLELEEKDNIVFHGGVDITVEAGCISVMGHLITPASGTHTLTSPLWNPSSLVDIQPVTPATAQKRYGIDLASPSSSSSSSSYNRRNHGKRALNVRTRTKSRTFLPSSVYTAVVTLRRSSSSFLIEKPSAVQLQQSNKNHSTNTPHSKSHDCSPSSKAPLSSSAAPATRDIPLPGFYPVLQVADETPLFDSLTVTDQWYHTARAFTNAQTPPVIIITGPRNAGKSTYGRFLVNTLLNKYEKVAFLDCDVGQCEFNPPGMVGLHMIDHRSPITGPPHTRTQHQPLYASFIGDTTATLDPSAYVQGIKNCFSYFQQHLPASSPASSVPLVINTQGWITGLGLQLLTQIIDITRPRHIVHFENHNTSSSSGGGNTDLGKHSKQSAASASSTLEFLQPFVGNGKKYSPSVHVLRRYSPATPVKHQRVSANHLRTLSLAAYFMEKSRSRSSGGRLISDQRSHVRNDNSSVSDGHGETGEVICFASMARMLAAQAPYCVPWKAVKMNIINIERDIPLDQYMYALNASIVGLCSSKLVIPRNRSSASSSSSVPSSTSTSSSSVFSPQSMLNGNGRSHGLGRLSGGGRGQAGRGYRASGRNSAHQQGSGGDGDEEVGARTHHAIGGTYGLQSLSSTNTRGGSNGRDGDGGESVELERLGGVTRYKAGCVPLAHCLGLGIIRSIDVENESFYILTPLAPSLLQHVDLVLKGSLCLPGVALQQAHLDSTPYLLSGIVSTASGASKMKSRNNLARKRITG